MFESQFQTQPASRYVRFVAISVAAHVAVVALVVVVFRPAREAITKLGTPVSFVVAPHHAPPPPPPPPPAAHRSRPKTVTKVTPVKVPELKIPPKVVEPKQPEHVAEAPKPEPGPPEPAGVQGGVAGGVAGGVVGGVVGGTGTGPVKPKNVPQFVIQRDIVRQVQPRLSEVFKQSHRNGPPIAGMYKVCVGLDGKVYEVIPVKAVPGADDDIVQGIKDGWEYKPQKVPVCFLYNIPITIQ